MNYAKRRQRGVIMDYTRFVVTINGKTPEEKSYNINLVQNILDGVEEEEILRLAEKKATIELQDALRKTGSIEAIEGLLAKQYSNATIQDHVKQASVNKQYKDAVAKYGKDAVDKALASLK